jgi:hypothetical protein
MELSFGEIERVGPDLKLQIFTGSHLWPSVFGEKLKLKGAH